MSDTPERRRNEKIRKSSATPKSDEETGAEATSEEKSSAPPAQAQRRWTFQANVGWALVTGLAIGFAVGREAHRFGMPDGRTAEDDSKSAFIAAETSGTAEPKGYKTEGEFPAGWVKGSDLANGATLFAGLSDAQKVTVMQALNERQCSCGCGYGSLAECLHKDPNCPNSPAIAKMSVDMIKQGKSLDQILAAIDDRQNGKQKPAAAAPEAPTTPHYVEVAAWNPRKGPKDAKVTIIEFSDFQ